MCIYIYIYIYIYVRACVRACMCVCVCVCYIYQQLIYIQHSANSGAFLFNSNIIHILLYTADVLLIISISTLQKYNMHNLVLRVIQPTVSNG